MEKVMLNLPANINKRERIVRGAVGGLLIIGAVLGLGHIFAFLIGVILVAEASISYCGFADLIERLKLDAENNTTPPSTPKKPPEA
jgi:hypothetical protein